MKERPILMTPENAQKCHDGTKTQTRRIVKLNAAGRVQLAGSPKNWHVGDPNAVLACPYGQVGDRLWVREAVEAEELRNGLDGVRYLADQSFRPIENTIEAGEQWGKLYHYAGKKGASVPSIHMPRWACRTVLEITEIRVQRLQEISEEDATAEGIEYHDGRGIGHSGYRHTQSHGYVYATARDAFKVLWESINGPGSWDANPWVWAISFRRMQP